MTDGVVFNSFGAQAHPILHYFYYKNKLKRSLQKIHQTLQKYDFYNPDNALLAFQWKKDDKQENKVYINNIFILFCFLDDIKVEKSVIELFRKAEREGYQFTGNVFVSIGGIPLDNNTVLSYYRFSEVPNKTNKIFFRSFKNRNINTRNIVLPAWFFESD